MAHLTLAALGVTEDPGTAWHPEKPEAYDADGNLRELSDEEQAAHVLKPETLEQPDAFGEPLAAEDSYETPDGEI